jgi:ABC-type multidrug transport system ATPase subunit
MDEAVHCDRLAIISEGNIVADDTPQNLLQRGRAKATVWRKGEMTMYELQDYPVDFPKALHAYGLDREIDRIEFAANTLESTLLDLITAAAKGGK